MRLSRFSTHRRWCFPLILTFQLFAFISCMDQETTVGTTATPMLDVSEFPEARRSPRFLCVQSGCTCDGVNEENATANCNCLTQGDDTNPIKISSTFLKFAGVRFPPNLKTIQISNCDFLDFGHNDEFSQLNLDEISIQNIAGVSIRPLALKKVAHFTVKNVAMLSFESRAFDSLEAESVHFVNVTFNKNSMNAFTHVGSISPLRIKSTLEFKSSKLSTDVDIQINQLDVANLTVSFRDCIIEGLKSTIRADRFELIGNKFPSLCSIPADVPLIPTPRVLESPDCAEKGNNAVPSANVEFYKSLELSGNIFHQEMMPDVRFNVQDKGVMDVVFPDDKKKNASSSAESAEKWLKSFTFDFKGIPATNKTNRGVNECKEKWVWGSKPQKYQIYCPDPQSMKKFVGSQKFKPLFRRPIDSSSSPISSSLFSLICATLILSGI